MDDQTTIIFFFLFFTSLTPLTTSSSTTNFLPKGSSFSVKHASASALLTSPNKTFSCGFYSVGTKANAYWFSIWYTNSDEKTVVWMANRNKPVTRHRSKLALRKDGTFVLSDFDGSIVWQTNTTSTDVDQAELLESGNLVLTDPNGKILWQSFDYPTDTLLPGQSFTKNMQLVSGIGHQMFGSGYFAFFFENDNVLKMLYDGPETSSVYWPNVDLTLSQNGRTIYNSTRIAAFDDMGTFVSSDHLQFSASDAGFGIKRRLTMDYDGNLRLYSLNDESGLWAVRWQALSRLCDVHGLCGRNGLCVYTPQPRCSCPPNYEPTDSTDWSKGCKPKFEINYDNFVQLPHINYYGSNLKESGPVSFEACKQLCLGDNNCQAFNYRVTGEGLCYTKTDLFNGYKSVYLPVLTYLRVPIGSPISAPATLKVPSLDCDGVKSQVIAYPGTHNSTWVFLFSFASAIGAIEIGILVIGWVFLFRKQDISALMEDGYRAILSQFRSFSYKELKQGTHKFKEVLGIGGFGTVYKGVLADGRVVAVKKLGDVYRGEEEFWAEVSTIGRINHMNLARMWGFCSEGKHRLLVYEYVENKSLDKHLFSNTTVLGWKERFKAAVGTAKGLAYLHHECLEWVIHCDVKPENILLDEDFEPKISDFGLAKLCQRGGNGPSEMSKIRGTKGYIAPEWAMNFPITAKVDVFSYGVVILELVQGIRLSNWVIIDDNGEEGTSEMVRFVKLAKQKIQLRDDLWVEGLVDPRLEGQFNRNQAATMIEVGLSCIEEDRSKRPTMEMVAQLLVECEDGNAMQ